MFTGYLIHTAVTICYYLILIVSLNLAIGYTGIINLGHVAFFAIGAYASAILTKAGVPFIAAFVLSTVIAGGFGWLLAWMTRRLKGDYVALATLGFSFVTVSIILNWRSLTRGPYGIAGIEKPNLFDWFLTSNGAYLVFAFFVMLIMVFLAYRMVGSPYGRLLEAVRDNEVGVSMLGKNTFRLKYQVLAVSAGMAGVSGSLFAHYITYIHPTNFFLADIILMLSIVIVGGLASLKGSIAATVLLIFLTESMRFLPFPSGIIGPVRLMVYAVLLIIILMHRPRGLFGKVDLGG